MKKNQMLIPFDNMNIKQIELKITDTFKWKHCKKLFTLSKVNDNNYQVIMVFDGIDIDLYYCNRFDIGNAINEINKYYFTFQEVMHIDIELI